MTLKGHDDMLYSVAFSHDSLYAIKGSCDKTAILYDLTDFYDKIN